MGMYFAAGVWFSLIVVLLFTGLLYLRARFPKASTRKEMAILLITTLLFFGVCYLFLPRMSVGARLPATHGPIHITSGSRLKQ